MEQRDGGERPGQTSSGKARIKELEREGLHDHIVVVTRWFGGKHLGGDRFRHVEDAVRIYLDNLREPWRA